MRKKILAAVLLGGAFLGLAAYAVSMRTKGIMVNPLAPSPYAKLMPFVAEDALPVLSEAMPEFESIQAWLNSDPINVADLKGKVVLIDFWTYSCINCIRTLPYVTSWHEKYKEKGFTVVGVHTPEFAFEKEEKNVRTAINRHGIEYPVALDNAYGTWNAYGNRYWPAHYLFDAEGRLRYYHFGEGKYDRTETAIQELLKEAGREAAMAVTEASTPDFSKIGSPETYLGYERMAGLASPEPVARSKAFLYTTPGRVELNRFAFSGTWTVEAERATAGQEAGLSYRYSAATANLVMGGGGRVEVRLDGRPVPASFSGADVKTDADGRTYVTIDSERLYELVNGRGAYGEHLLELRFEPGISIYAFTFG